MEQIQNDVFKCALVVDWKSGLFLYLLMDTKVEKFDFLITR